MGTKEATSCPATVDNMIMSVKDRDINLVASFSPRNCEFKSVLLFDGLNMLTRFCVGKDRTMSLQKDKHVLKKKTKFRSFKNKHMYIFSTLTD